MAHRQPTEPRDRGDDVGDRGCPAERLLNGEGAACYPLAVTMLGSGPAAAEVVGQVLAAAIGAGPAARTRQALTTEIHRVAADRLRERPDRADPDRVATVETGVWDGITDPRVRDVLADLPALARRTVLLVYFAGYRIRELAHALDRDPAELRTALHTATTALRRDPRTFPAR